MNVSLEELSDKAAAINSNCFKSSFYKFYLQERYNCSNIEDFVNYRCLQLMKKPFIRGGPINEAGNCKCSECCENHRQLQSVRSAARIRLEELVRSSRGIPSCSTTLASNIDSILNITNCNEPKTEIIDVSVPDATAINGSAFIEDIVPEWDDTLSSEDDASLHVSSAFLKYLSTKLPKEKVIQFASGKLSGTNNETNKEPPETQDVEAAINITFEKLSEVLTGGTVAESKINTTFDKSPEFLHDETECEATGEISRVDELGLPQLRLSHNSRGASLTSPSPDTIHHYRRVRDRSLSRISTFDNESNDVVSTTFDNIPDISSDQSAGSKKINTTYDKKTEVTDEKTDDTKKINTTFDKKTEVAIEKTVKNLNPAMPLKQCDLQIKKVPCVPKRTGPMKATAPLCGIIPAEVTKQVSGARLSTKHRRSRSLSSPGRSLKESFTETPTAPIATSTPTKDVGAAPSIETPFKNASIIDSSKIDSTQTIHTDFITTMQQPTLRKSRSQSALRVSHKINQITEPPRQSVSKLPSKLPSKVSKLPQRELIGKENIRTKRF